MNDRVTMASIAKQVGVHVTTVSLALRNHPSLPAATRERIQATAKKMGYHPDPALSSLIAYRAGAKVSPNRHVLAYLTHWPTPWGWKSAPGHPKFFTGAEAKATELGYRLEHFWLGQPDLTHQRMSDILRARGIAGLIIASHTAESDVELQLDWPRFSAVKIDRLPHNPDLHHVTNNQRAISQLAMRRVMAAGYRRIGFALYTAWDSCVDLAWSGGFMPEQHKLPSTDHIPPLFFAAPDADGLAPRDVFEAWFNEHRPEALIGYGPHVLPRLAEMGVKVPRDVAFVDVLIDEPSPKIAGVRQNCHRVGELAVEILVGQLHQHIYGLPSFPTATLVGGTWFDGESLPTRNGAQLPAPAAMPAPFADEPPFVHTQIAM